MLLLLFILVSYFHYVFYLTGSFIVLGHPVYVKNLTLYGPKLKMRIGNNRVKGTYISFLLSSLIEKIKIKNK